MDAVVFGLGTAALWFWVGWVWCRERQQRRQGEMMRTMFAVLEAQTKEQPHVQEDR